MRRIEQVNTLIREEVARIVDRDIELPPHTFVTFTNVITSSDLHYADVFFTVLPRQREADAMAVLELKVGDIQHSLNRKLRMRPVPRIKFRVDVVQKRADRIEHLLAEERLKNKE